jgi:hypothetical protein
MAGVKVTVDKVEALVQAVGSLTKQKVVVGIPAGPPEEQSQDRTLN